MARRHAAVFGIVAVVACADERRQDDATSVAPLTTIGDTQAGDDDGEDSTTGDGDDGDDGDGADDEKLDAAVDTMGDNPGDDMLGCEKVDLLFVIDDSGSMADEQANLVASFPGFIAAMQSELSEADGYHVAVVTTDVYIYDLECSPLSIGNFVVRTGGPDSSNGQCGPFGPGRNYLVETDDLAAEFGCIAQVGTGGSGNEHPMEAMLTALSPPLTDDGGCNAGFLRDDALLVVVVITDEEDDHEVGTEECEMIVQDGSPGGPPTWFDDLVAIKGKQENVVMLSLVGPDAQAGSMCPELDKCNGGIAGAEVATRLLEFTRMFTYGFIGPVCQDYAPIFQEAISVIKTACDEFDPIG